MPISRPKVIKCKKCKKKYTVLIRDVRPQRIECPDCGFMWFYVDESSRQ